MQIGFDAKRAFQNPTGLGNYSRSLITSLASYYPDNKYTLYAPRPTELFNTNDFTNIRTRVPQKKWDQQFPAWWRRSSIIKDIATDGISIYHGLSNELPKGIHTIPSLKTVITVHDLIFERYPETYHFDERYTHRWKMKRSCEIADAVIAASMQTKNDLIHFYKISPEKIHVCYQNCNPVFETTCSNEEKAIVKKRYNLPEQYFLFVSSITKRKNLIAVCRALALLKDKVNIPLVVIGRGKKEKIAVEKFILDNQLTQQVIFLNDLPQANEPGFVSSADFPAIYQQALALVYPSYFEGFGIPLLEAMWSSVPVISSNASCLPEVAGEAALYFAPGDVQQLAEHMLQISANPALAIQLAAAGIKKPGYLLPGCMRKL